MVTLIDVLSLVNDFSGTDYLDDNVVQFPGRTAYNQEERTAQALNTQQSPISKGQVAAESKLYEKILLELLKYSK